MSSDKSQEQVDLVTNLPYYSRISTLHNDFPHLQSLSLYMQAIEHARMEGRLGSHDSDSILVAEVSTTGDVTYDRIDCYDLDDLHLHQDMLSGNGNQQAVSARILAIEDLSPGAIEALGTGFNLDPHVFYFHLGFDTRRSAMANLVDPVSENTIPVTWCMPNHAPNNFISVPVPCDLKPLSARKLESSLREDRTYSRQAYRPLA
ncbi:hypothetical protein CC78DRAFT_578251 [Lojkania enalia]|uniref:Uncharacterized protein n=1 Tax=Lojkania enalia TaxID=147567 RepID=A0A9P4KF53_9PLEO|nr:hypothetical protein CC78DRAFT_578251 [Didymosphaeria enalia]